MAYPIPLSFFISFLIFISTSTAKTSFWPHGLILPVTKDQSTKQHLTQIHHRTPLVPLTLTVDLGGQFLWVDCEQKYVSSTYRPLNCSMPQCVRANGLPCLFLDDKTTTCLLFPNNPITNNFIYNQVAEDVLSLQSTDGTNPGPIVSARSLLFTCGKGELLQGLPNGVKGIAGLGRTYAGLPTQLARAFRFPRKFAICLTSSPSSKGVIFFGDGSYVMLPNNKVVSDSLAYTPLYINPRSAIPVVWPSPEYFIGVKSIRINGKSVPMNSTLLNITEAGIGGTKISTVDPYTVMEKSIFSAVIRSFVQAQANVPLVKPVAPFKICYNKKRFNGTKTGPGVPPMELVLQGKNVSWFIYGANLMVPVSDKVLCLGIVDGGLNTRTSIVIGAHQIEDNLLQFDISKSRLGFSSSLLLQQTACANFNFTSKA